MIAPVLMFCLKLSIALSVLMLCYQLFLSRLTFFTSIRWYFIFGILLSFILSTATFSSSPISPVSFSDPLTRYIPSLHQFSISETTVTDTAALPYSPGQWLIFFWILGMTFFIARFVIQFSSLIGLKKRAIKLVPSELPIYILDQKITPFSFIDSIFINPTGMSSDEYEKIIRHEWIHIRQRHSFDILIGELICILNWYNPVAWLLKKSIRQNLEYLTDDLMVRQGVDAQAYQYLLVKALGQNTYSFSSTFNFHSLKSRLLMINRIKSHPFQRLKFLIVLPVVLILLLAFRSAPAVIPDTLTSVNAFIDIPISLPSTDLGSSVHPQPAIVPFKSISERFITDTVPQKKSKKDEDYSMSWSWSTDEDDEIRRITIQGNSDDGDVATVYFINGDKKAFNLNDIAERREFNDKYGSKMPMVPPVPPVPPIPPVPPVPPVPPIPPVPPVPPVPPLPGLNLLEDIRLPDDILEISQTREKIKFKFKDGHEESYDMNDPKSKKKLKEKFKDIEEH